MKKLLVFITTVFLIFQCVNGQDTKKTLDSHFDVIEQFSSIKSKSRQMVIMGKKQMEGKSALDSLAFLYMELKSSSDGAIDRYKSIIDNPAMAKKSGATITNQLNTVINNLNNLTVYYLENSKQGMGLIGIPGLSVISSITEIGKNVYGEIKSFNKAKRDEIKAELDKYILSDFDEVK